MSRTDDANWWRHAVIYQIYPRSFADANGDGIGDLAGIRRRLGYVRELGADAVWICPFVRSPMKDFGYDVSDYRDVEPVFGSLDDFDALVSHAHSLGLRVLIDQVWNHTSDQHSWFLESRASRDNPKADWYVWADPAPDGGPPNNWRATFGGSAWAWDGTRHQYYLHNFLVEQPDLNWYNPGVRAALIEVGRFWLDRGVDGFRLDVANFFAHDRSLADNPRRPADLARPAGAARDDPYFDFINRGTVSRPETWEMLGEVRALMDAYPGTVALGEISSAEDSLASAAEAVRGRDRLHTAYNASLVSDEPFTADGLRRLLDQMLASFEAPHLCWTFGTHDFPRLKGRWALHRRHDDDTEARLDRLLATLLLVLPGSCCLYQGDELGLTQAQLGFEQLRDPYGIANYPQILGRDGCRTPMPWTDAHPGAGFTDADEPWLPIAAEHLPLAVSRQQADPASLLNAWKRLLAWRRAQPALREDRLQPVDAAATVLAFERGERNRMLCVFNLSHEAAVHRLPGGWKMDPEASNLATLPPGGLDPLHLPGYGCAIAHRR
ncbi:alpha-glucosidase [Marilutibacter chinensis]|uniref:Alpha-glucosidase family protein n=1 Tax=Marilutibacter chinensis TaxID=2912247 RepID=A0ABS9HNT5_9GAMM|nr:alpha-glucosidase [Lysobacter chinensis]MCF7220649.1 alpha-glucosidase family protein [Lysobacter chinensis]